MRWLLLIISIVAVGTWFWREPPAKNINYGIEPKSEVPAVVWNFLRTRQFDPTEWNVCVDRKPWHNAQNSALTGLRPASGQTGALWVEPYHCTESHGMWLLLGASTELRRQYPNWPRKWLQFSQVGFDRQRSQAGFAYRRTQVEGESVQLLSGWAVLDRSQPGWKLREWGEKPEDRISPNW